MTQKDYKVSTEFCRFCALVPGIRSRKRCFQPFLNLFQCFELGGPRKIPTEFEQSLLVYPKCGGAVPRPFGRHFILRRQTRGLEVYFALGALGTHSGTLVVLE